MAFQRIVSRTLPDGTIARVFPFHISLEGLESNLICREEEDYAVVDKLMFVSAWACNTLIIIEIVMSSHGHIGLLAPSLEHARKTAEVLKQKCSMYLAYKYNERHVLRDTEAYVQLLENDWHVRNVLAYIPRNIVETGIRIEDYPWCGFRGMFTQGSCADGVKAVSALTRREKEMLFHTHADLSRVPWKLDRADRLVPASCCDWQYLESAFLGDQAFFLKTIGSVNCAEMEQTLLNAQRRWRPDAEFLLTANDVAGRWFQKSPAELTLEQKSRLIPYLYRCYRTSVSQLARCLKTNPEFVSEMIRKR